LEKRTRYYGVKNNRVIFGYSKATITHQERNGKKELLINEKKARDFLAWHLKNIKNIKGGQLMPIGL
jgi:hypothetical protein